MSLRYACWPTQTNFRKVVPDTVKTFCIFLTSFFYWMNCKKTKSWKIKPNSYSWPHSCWHHLFELFSSQNNCLLWAQLWKLHEFSMCSHCYLIKPYQSLMQSLLLINTIFINACILATVEIKAPRIFCSINIWSIYTLLLKTLQLK